MYFPKQKQIEKITRERDREKRREKAHRYFEKLIEPAKGSVPSTQQITDILI